MKVYKWLSAMREHLYPYAETYAATQYHDLASDKAIEAFLQSEDLWDSSAREWKALLDAGTQENLEMSVRDVMDAIITKLGRSHAIEGSTREARRVPSASEFAHMNYHATTTRTSPPVMIRACGPSFETPDGAVTDQDLGYTNAASCVSVGLEAYMPDDDIYHVEQSSIHAW